MITGTIANIIWIAVELLAATFLVYTMTRFIIDLFVLLTKLAKEVWLDYKKHNQQQIQ